MEKSRISHHASVLKAYERIKKDGITNVWDRYEAQGMGGNPDQRCAFCLGGTRCDLCSNGPCRSDAAKDTRGVCGITADGMAMRMMLLRNVMGASTYQYHTDQTVKTLRATAQGRQAAWCLRHRDRPGSRASSVRLRRAGIQQEVRRAQRHSRAPRSRGAQGSVAESRHLPGWHPRGDDVCHQLLPHQR
jgi:carbon-monoxide dehydrogenase catalytic subunit